MQISANALAIYAQLIASKVNLHNVPTMYGVGSALLALATISVILRIYVRTRMIKCWGWDDWLILLSLAIFVGEVVILFKFAKVEAGPKNLTTLMAFSQLLWSEQILYVSGTIALKLSIAVFFLRFIVDSWARTVVWASTIIYCTFALSALLLVVFECGVPGIISLKQAEGQCVGFDVIESYAYAQGVSNAVSDWICALLPMYFLLKSKMPLVTKLSASVILAFAVAGSIASCVRTYYVKGFTPGGDLLNTSLNPMIWTVVEPGLGITAASLACLKPLLKSIVSSSRSAIDSALGRSNKKGGIQGGSSNLTEPLSADSSKNDKSMAFEDMLESNTRMDVMDLEKGPIGVTTTNIVGG